MKKKYFISPIARNRHDLMKVLAQRLSLKGYNLIFRHQQLSISRLIEKKNYFLIINELIKRIIWRIYIYIIIFIKRNKTIMFVWPQIIGFDVVLKSIKHNKVILYIMDNSFFCIRSYNIHPTRNNECLDCLGFIKPHKLCFPFHRNYKKFKNIEYLNLLKDHSHKIIFYSQNNLQKLLLKKHFGNKINVKVVGMNIGKLKKTETTISSKAFSYDIVFHAYSHKAKGLLYTIKLAKLLPNQSFLIPDTKENVLKATEIKNNLPANITFKKMNWDSGLKEMVISAGLVINPSIWSAPIEAALLKSAAFNQNVATVASSYGYEKEIKSIKNHIRLSTDISIAAEQIKKFFKNYN